MTRLFPGDRRVWAVAAAVAAVFGALIAYHVLKPRDYFTGTNSISPRTAVAPLGPGGEACVRALDIPADTARIRLQVDVHGRRATLAGRLGTERRDGAPARVTVEPGLYQPVDFPVARRPGSPESVPGTFCVRVESGRRVDLRGMPGLQGDDVPPTADGRPIRSRLSVVFLPRAGDRLSLAARAPDLFRRAALFRPGIVGPWVYPLLVLLVLPLTLFAAVRLIATTAAGRRSRVPRGVAIAALVFANATAWAVITPAFDAPDEPDHFGYAQYLAETGNAPAAGSSARSAWSAEESVALDGVRILSRASVPDGRPPWLSADERRWKRYRARLEPGPSPDSGGGATTSSTHSPVYYSLLVPMYLATSGYSTFSQLTAMRLVSALLGALTALFAYLVVRELLPRHSLAAVAAGLLVGFQPMFGFISGAVNNDNGVNAVAALLVWLLLRALRRGLTVPLGAAIGATLVALPLMKATGYALYPAALLALAGVLWRQHRRLDAPVWAAVGGTFVIALLGWRLISPAFDRSLYTTPGGRAPTAVGVDVFDNLSLYASYLWQVFLPKLPFMADLHGQTWPAFNIYIERGWAAFGWYAVTFPRWVYGVIGAVMVAAGGLCALALWRHRQQARAVAVQLAVLAAALVGVIAAVEYLYTTSTPRSVVAEQGRYVFTAIVPLAIAAVGAAFAFPRRLRLSIIASLVIGVLGLSYASQLLALSRFFA